MNNRINNNPQICNQKYNKKLEIIIFLLIIKIEIIIKKTTILIEIIIFHQMIILIEKIIQKII